MTYRHVALLGKARAGKDAIGARLAQRYAFVRVAFADPLRELALDLDPIVATEPTDYGPMPLRLSDLVAGHGWDVAKGAYPEVRRCLQRLGTAVRMHDPDYWLRIALERVTVAERWSIPVVITDVRHANELQTLRERGALVVRVVRPGVDGLAGPEAEHITETALDQVEADVTVINSGSLADLHQRVDTLAVWQD
ncbi:hypothetical protein [Kitasatospora sp. NPDC001527]|uniref:deoxynucleotide monophosphate kinase family protein n=1 Tax=Kitasatospora sp. NPDC001527 TaxID=3154519 RepID=UPI00332F7BFA